MPAMYPPDMADVPAGSKLLFEVHYTPDGNDRPTAPRSGSFARKPPANSVEMNILANMLFRIPPRTSDYQGQMTFTFPKDALVLAFMPHMHLRGVSARYVLTRPDGSTETLLSVPDYDFNWQSVYRFEKPLEIPKGSKLTWIGRWDNSEDNPRNPDPNEVRPLGLADLGRDAERMDGSGVEEAEGLSGALSAHRFYPDPGRGCGMQIGGTRTGIRARKRLPRPGAVLDFEGAAVVAEDPVADGEAQARPAAHRLGGEEGLEDVRQVLGTDPAAVVFDLHQRRRPRRRAGCAPRSVPRGRTPGWRWRMWKNT